MVRNFLSIFISNFHQTPFSRCNFASKLINPSKVMKNISIKNKWIEILNSFSAEIRREALDAIVTYRLSGQVIEFEHEAARMAFLFIKAEIDKSQKSKNQNPQTPPSSQGSQDSQNSHDVQTSESTRPSPVAPPIEPTPPIAQKNPTPPVVHQKKPILNPKKFTYKQRLYSHRRVG